MRITFVDFIDIDYVADTPEAVAIGGSQSAVCYLARALAARDLDVRMVTQTTRPGHYDGVECLSLDDGLEMALVDSDFVVSVNNASRIGLLRHSVPDHARLVMWSGHDADQPGVLPLADPTIRDRWDAFALVSDWQANRFAAEFGLPSVQVGIMRNAIAPVFEHLAINGKAFHGHESLAYTSTPFRGLHVLLHAMPAIRLANPSVGLKVYSSMSLYHTEEDPFGKLYDWAKNEPGVQYSPAIAQSLLPSALADVAILAYPNTFDETSCITVMEAMAAGCKVVTTRRGALPETTAGHARLIEPDPDLRVLSKRFAAAVSEELSNRKADPEAFAAQIDAQVRDVNDTMTWANRATDWTRWLASL